MLEYNACDGVTPTLPPPSVVAVTGKSSTNTARTDFGLSIVTLNGLALPLASSDQWSNTQPEFGVAVTLTTVLLG